MSENVSSKSLALFVTNKTITFLTKTIQQDENFYSEAYTINYTSDDKTINLEEVKNSIISNLPLLLYYDKIFVNYHSTTLSVVPYEYFNTDLINNYQLSTDLSDTFSSIKCNQIDSFLVFKNILPIHQILIELPNYKNAIFSHTGKSLIENSKINKEKIQIFAQLINQKLELCIYNKGIFTLYSIYDIIGDDDILYYILNTIQQFKLDPTKIEVIFENGVKSDHYISFHLPKYVHTVTYNDEADALGSKYLLYKIFECE